ncbi:MAG: hypothetical protein AAGU11_12725 [Syntrophobacteraceae bacterium]
MKEKYLLTAVLCFVLGTGVFWAVSGSSQVDAVPAMGHQGKPLTEKSKLHPALSAEAEREQKSGQVEDPDKVVVPAAKKARGTFNPTEGC